MKFPKKSLGQNFLIDKNIIKKIINLSSIRGKNIIEIGPGKGALTDEILKREPKTFYLIEKDFYLAQELKKKYLKKKNVKVYNSDILNFDIEKIIENNSIIFGNLPYNISSQILVKFLKFKKWPPKYNGLIFMFQKELAEKIIAKFPSNNYGRLAILTNFRLEMLEKFTVSNNCFFPKPKITSMVIYLKPKKHNENRIKKIENLEKITSIFFSNKRKMINKNVRKVLTLKSISKIKNLNLRLRPSNIKPEIYYQITKLLEEE